MQSTIHPPQGEWFFDGMQCDGVALVVRLDECLRNSIRRAHCGNMNRN